MLTCAGVDVVEDEVLVDDVVLLVDAVVTGVAMVAIWVGGVGGSRWNIPESEVIPLTPAPTAKPSVGEVR